MKNIALIGAGRWGKNLARNFYNLGALHTICDKNQALLNQYLENCPGVELTSSLQEVLENPHITRVVIAAPALLHYKIAKQALLADKDVYVEKPLCLDAEEGEELVELAREREKILMVGHLLHYHPMVCKLQEMVTNGELGNLQYITSNRLDLGDIRTEENALWNFAPHDISVILSLCGNKMPSKIQCTGGNFVTDGIADTTLTALSFENNIRSHIYVSWLHPFKEQKLTVVGTGGMVQFDDTKPWNEKLIFSKTQVKWTKESTPYLERVKGEFIIVPQDEPLALECRHFIECCNTRKPPRTDGHEALRVLKVLHAAQENLTKNLV